MSKPKSKYGQKRASGNMVYGPAPHVPKYPDFEAGKVRVFCTCCNPPRVYRICQAEKDAELARIKLLAAAIR